MIGSNVHILPVNITKWYLDGTDTNAVTNSPKYVGTTLNVASSLCKLTNATDDMTFGHVNNAGNRYRGTGKFDNIYMFDAALTTAQITRLANGGNGADEALQVLVAIKPVKHADSSRQLIRVNDPSDAVNSFTVTNGTDTTLK